MITKKSQTFTGIKQTKNTKKNKLKLGCHVSIQPDIITGLKYGESIDANAIQIFLGSNRSSSLKTKTKLTTTDITTINQYLKSSNMILIIHSIYLLNLCTAPHTSGKVKYMNYNLLYDLEMGSKLGAKCVILHLGFKKDLPLEKAINNLIDNINYVLEKKPAGICLAIETSAGQGSQIGYKLEELAEIWKGIKHHGSKNVGICIDTAHIFVSGYDISTLNGCKTYLNEFNRFIGWKYITNFHINDSKYISGSRKDEHQGLTYGKIFNTPAGIQTLKYIKYFCYKRHIPMILETHSAGSFQNSNINSIKNIKKSSLSLHTSNKHKYNISNTYQAEIQFIRNL